jgi:hypothetical protein
MFAALGNLDDDMHARKYRNVEVANRSFENVARLKYFGMTTNQNEVIKRKLNLGNACYLSVQNLLPSHLSKNVKKYNFSCGLVWV